MSRTAVRVRAGPAGQATGTLWVGGAAVALKAGSHAGRPGLRSQRVQTETRANGLGLPPRRPRPGEGHVEPET